MEFKEFKELQQRHFDEMSEQAQTLYIVDVDKDELWEIYLDSFPKGTNKVFRERREFDCGCCRHFIKSFGNIVTIQDNEIVTIWDFDTQDETYQPVIDTLSELIKSANVRDVFVTREKGYGTDFNHEQLEDGTVLTWHHFRVDLPKKFISNGNETIGTLTGQYRDIRNVFQRSLEEITEDSIETLLDLIAQKSLYKGEEWRGVLNKFLQLHKEYHNLPDEEKDNYCWVKSVEVGGSVGKIRNHSIGTLLVDLSSNVDLNEAVRKYEKIVAPTNYKRPKAIFTKKMVEQAQKAIEELGLTDSLGRRFATIEDITVNNILFANRNAKQQMIGNVFDELKEEAITNPKKFDKLEEVTIEDFVENILPRTSSFQLFLENNHIPNLVSVIAPQDKDAKSMLKWNNNFSWAYNGNITDSMKERVKAFGGKVDGVLRVTLQWDNNNDLDLHCVEPNGNHIFFNNKGRTHQSSGMLDVDIIEPNYDPRVTDGTAVENIIYSNEDRMQEGVYEIFIHCYSYRGGRNGFQAELEYDGQIYSYEYPNSMRETEKVTVAKFRYSKKEGIKFIESLPSSMQSKIVWNLKTNEFHSVTLAMYSPNYWDEQKGIGHRHYMFILQNCQNDDAPNGFFNEFMSEDLMKHKRVFEALGSKMRVEQSDNQLSGLGFSSTKRNSLICKVEGYVSRIIKIVF